MVDHSSFLEYCAQQGVDPEEYGISVPRYIRVNPKKPVPTTTLKEQLGDSLTPVPWLPVGFFSLNADVNLVDSSVYQAGHVYGIDAASAAAVLALSPNKGDSVLDLCCAPGTKMALIADILWMYEQEAQGQPSSTSDSSTVDGHSEAISTSSEKTFVPTAVVTGVDISVARLHTTRSVLKKYGVHNCRLIWADGASWQPLQSAKADPEWWQDSMPLSTANPRKFRKLFHKVTGQLDTKVSANNDAVEGDKDADPEDVGTPRNAHTAPKSGSAAPMPPLHGVHLLEPASGHLRSQHKYNCRSRGASGPLPSCLPPPKFNRVLVDAECTHDGSIRHIAKLQSQGKLNHLHGLQNDGKLRDLYELQYRLLRNGYSLLAPGGVLVYSTCSLSTAQNEDVLDRFLSIHPEACLVPLFGLCRHTSTNEQANSTFTSEHNTCCTSRRNNEDHNLLLTFDASLVPGVPGRLPHTMYFRPSVSHCSGLFIAKIKFPAEGSQ